MEKSGFFNSVNGDRKYKAEDWANYFKRFLTNGIFPVPSTNLQVMANSDMTITVKPGAGWINGYIYENTSDLILPIDPADGVLNRIDRVVLKYDIVAREIKAIVKKGSPASSPTAPVLQRDADAYELGLADINILAGATSIEQFNITDIRLNTELCGIVNSLIKADTTTLLNQYSSGMQAKMVEFQAAFETWFETVQAILDENTAGNLLNLINALSDSINTLNSNFSDLQSDVASHKADIANKTDAAKGAALIGMKPITGLAGDNVRTAISNLFTFANDGKTAIANAVTAKGVAASPSDTFATLATKIGQISTGKKFATGTETSASSRIGFINGYGESVNMYYISVSGLPFKPKTIIVYDDVAYGEPEFVYHEGVVNYEGYYLGHSISYGLNIRKTGNFMVTDTSMQIPVGASSRAYRWYIYGY